MSSETGKIISENQVYTNWENYVIKSNIQKLGELCQKIKYTETGRIISENQIYRNFENYIRKSNIHELGELYQKSQYCIIRGMYMNVYKKLIVQRHV